MAAVSQDGQSSTLDTCLLVLGKAEVSKVLLPRLEHTKSYAAADHLKSQLNALPTSPADGRQSASSIGSLVPDCMAKVLWCRSRPSGCCGCWAALTSGRGWWTSTHLPLPRWQHASCPSTTPGEASLWQSVASAWCSSSPGCRRQWQTQHQPGSPVCGALLSWRHSHLPFLRCASSFCERVGETMLDLVQAGSLHWLGSCVE